MLRESKHELKSSFFELVNVLTVVKTNQSGRNKRFNIKTLLYCVKTIFSHDKEKNAKRIARKRWQARENAYDQIVIGSIFFWLAHFLTQALHEMLDET